MKTALQIDLTFNQVLSMVKQLPRQQKIKLTKELEKEAIETKLSRLLKTFKTSDLDLETINKEVENVRLGLYDKKRIKVIFDTNIWISFLTGKRLQSIKQYISEDKIVIVTKQQLLTEIKTVTNREKMKKYFPRESVKELIKLLETISENYQISTTHFISRDPKDNFLFDLIDFSKADYLVTGDKGLLEHNPY